MRSLLISILLVFSCLSIHAQKEPTDTINADTSEILWFYVSKPIIGDSLPTDSTFTPFKGYNFIRKFPTLNTGFAGGARYSPVLNRVQTQPHLISGYQSYFFKEQDVTYFYAPRPYSQATYINGGAREEYFNLTHTQNFGESLNFKLDFNKQGSEGFYNHQGINHTFFNTSTNFKSRHGVYGFFAHFRTNRVKAEENGGFQDFSQLTNPELTGTSNLESAINNYRANHYYVRQFVRFGRFDRSIDADSIETKKFDPLFELSYTFKYGKGFRIYEDNLINPSYYPNIYFNNTSMQDSIGFKYFENLASLSSIHNGKIWLSVNGGHEFYHYHQNIQVDTSYNNFKAGATLNLSFKEFNWISDAMYYLDGYNSGDIYFNSKISRISADSINSPDFYAELDFSLVEPAYFLIKHNSNLFRWDQRFNKTNTSRLSAGINWYGFDLSTHISNIGDLIYFNESIQPKQSNDQIQVINFIGMKKVSLGKFHLENSVSYQLISDKEVLPFPDLVLRETFYFESFIFNKALLSRLGVSLYYTTDYQAMNYMPALAQFYLQNNSTPTNLGNYPVFDLFVDMKVKRMKIFLMLSHFNEGMSGDDIYYTPGYPIPPRAFKFGINWNFFD